jgi:Tfp pilus assembly protein PilV
LIRFLKNQQGISLIEVIILIIIVGVALPSLYTLNAIVLRYHAKNEIIAQANSMADSRVEEIISFKKENGNWSKYISSYNQSESLAGGFMRVTTVTSVSGWGAEGLNAFRIEVTVSHTELVNGYRLTVMLAR